MTDKTHGFDLDFLEECDAEWASQQTATTTEKVAFPCVDCGGTGESLSKPYGWSGVRYKQKCPACKGKGEFKTSAKAREYARMKAQARAKATMTEKTEAFEENNPGLVASLREMVSWNSFAGSLVSQFDQKGSMSDNQVKAAKKMIAKVAATKAARAEAKANAPDVGFDKVFAMFENAKTNNPGKNPRFYAEGLLVYPAGKGANTGAIYVKASDTKEYLGKIMPNGKYHASYGAPVETTDALYRIAENPFEAAIKWGKENVKCSCCNRKLTNKVSRELGIGPICRENWGL